MEAFRHGYALLIAVDQSAAPAAALPDVVKDVDALYRVLTHPQLCAYPAENVKRISGADSSRSGILDALTWLQDKLQRDTTGNTTAVIYFTGHGHAEGGSHYLLPYDIDLKRIRSSALRADDFAAEIAALHPRRLFVALDCCHAAGIGVKNLDAEPRLHSAAIPPELFLGGADAEVGIGDAKGLAAGTGRAVLSSSRADEKSYLRPDRKMSVFTYHLVEALTGHAQPRPGAAEVLVSDVIGHVQRHVPASAAKLGQSQNPQVRLDGEAFAIARLLGGKGLGAGEIAPDPLTLPPVPASGGIHIGGANSGPINYGGSQTNIHTGGGDYHAVAKEADEAQSVIPAYLEALSSELARVPLGEIDDKGIDTAQQKPLELSDVYVPLDTTLQIPATLGLAEYLAPGGAANEKLGRQTTAFRKISALEALATHQELTVLGSAGSGKSTFGASVLLALAQARLGHAGELEKLGETWTHGPLLPIRIVLRRFAETLVPNGPDASAGDLWAFVAQDFHDAGYGLCPRAIDHVQRIAREEGALIVFDGLDECGNPAKQQRVLAGVRQLMKSARKHCRFLLTARPTAWPGGPDPQRGVYALAEFDDGQVECFIRAWYEAVVSRGWYSAADAAKKCDNLLGARNRPDLRPLAANPLLLTLMSSLHANSAGCLPDDRADLYESSVELLMRRWTNRLKAEQTLLEALDINGLTLTNLRDALEKLAFEVHAANVGSEGAADIGESRLERAFLPLLGGSKDKAGIVVDYIEKRAGLLIGHGTKHDERQYGFPHRTFQEFLAACDLSKQADFEPECARLARAAAGHWQEVLALAARKAGPARGASAADEIVGGRSVPAPDAPQPPSVADWTSAWLAGLQLKEIGPRALRMSPRMLAIADKIAGWLTASLPVLPSTGGAPATQRARNGDLLAKLGDPRFDAERYYLPADETLGFVRIATDPQFMIGTRKEDAARVKKYTGLTAEKYEFNDKITPTQEFHIARYPVTVAQFRAYCDAAGVRPGDKDALRDPDNRPVRRVSWYEARAYCKWLQETFATSPILAGHPIARLVREEDWRVTLPSELEWEKAARGKRVGALFPWGDEPDRDRANCAASEIGDTSAVGCFPANDLGLHDMVGNVWEWTRSLWGSNWDKPQFGYPYDAGELQRENLDAPDKMLRVVRGGSWGLLHDLARCAIRSWNLPGYRLDLIGFRVVLRSSPVS